MSNALERYRYKWNEYFKIKTCNLQFMLILQREGDIQKLLKYHMMYTFSSICTIQVIGARVKIINLFWQGLSLAVRCVIFSQRNFASIAKLWHFPLSRAFSWTSHPCSALDRPDCKHLRHYRHICLKVVSWFIWSHFRGLFFINSYRTREVVRPRSTDENSCSPLDQSLLG